MMKEFTLKDLFHTYDEEFKGLTISVNDIRKVATDAYMFENDSLLTYLVAAQELGGSAALDLMRFDSLLDDLGELAELMLQELEESDEEEEDTDDEEEV